MTNHHYEWIWYGEDEHGDAHVSLGRWAKHPCQMRYKLAEIQPTEHDNSNDKPATDDGWLPIKTAPRDGTVIQVWHQVHKCPVSVLWKDDGFPYKGERLNWFERTYTTAWPESAFTHWRNLPTLSTSKDQ